MSVFVELARAKVNLNLHVLGRRQDGYHSLSSIVAFADVGDRLALTAAQQNQLAVSGPFAQDVPVDDNIVWKAWRYLGEILALPPVSVRLKKNLPVGAGLGGGSADAAAMMRELLRLVGGALRDDQVRDMARRIGADVPVCFHSQACVMQGIGEEITPFSKTLPPALVLVNPMVGTSTAEVFAALNIKPGTHNAAGNATWRNDMTDAAIGLQPAIGEVLAAFAQTSLASPLMSGSGSTCFAVARNYSHAARQAAIMARKHPQWWIKAGRLG